MFACSQFAGSQGTDTAKEFVHDGLNGVLVEGLTKEKSESLPLDADLLKDPLDITDAFMGAEVSVHGTARSDSATDKADGIAACLEGA